MDRGFKEISVSVCGVQPATKLDDTHPGVATWRNNLTGLSQVWNLYFVAHQDRIHVYQPQYPTQRISCQPTLVLCLPVSRPGQHGYIDDHDYPHAVNNLLVAHLGEQEVLACVCDDGDVVVYHTRAIIEAVRRRSKSTYEDEEYHQEIRTFLVDNVRLSAWGLAIHTAGRMLAVSSNTGDITVFAFALALTDEHDGGATDLSQDDFDEVDRESAWDEFDETNSDSSYDAAYLSAPTSSLRQITEPSPNNRAKNKRITLSGNDTNIPNIAFCNSAEDPEGRWLSSTDIEGYLIIWDIWVRRPVSIWRFGDQLHGQPQRGEELETRGWGVLCLDPRSFRSAQGASQMFGCIPKRDEKCWCNSHSRLMIRDSIVWHRNEASIVNESPDFDDPIFELHLPHMAIRGLHQSMTLGEYYHEPQCPWPTNFKAPFGVLHTTAGSIRLMENTQKGPSLICRSPLIQIPLHPIHPHYGCERMNMLAQAPELGLVFVATQSGRVAILSLTQGRAPQVLEKAFRIEAFLPLRSQEEQGLRPNTPLLGFATGPVQTRAMESAEDGSVAGGTDGTTYGGQEESAKRIRLMLTYQDRTVMSYEISRTDSASYVTKSELLVL
ncbi:MAG: hypothetical protein M1835_004681 [Candelina submexicana]|nr:MAG: hypothetical protein M1835_004681 [Candelina submexicana]